MGSNNKKIAVFLGHPAHFHLYKHVVNTLIKNGYDVTYLIKRKDILEDLVKQTGVPYTVVRDKERAKSSKLGLIFSMLKLDFNVFKSLLKFRPKLLTGTYCPIFSKLTFIPFISCNEDDAKVVPNFAILSYPPANSILTPVVCDNGKWNGKSTKYPSYHELAYLHPNHFTANKSVVNGYGIDTNKPYFVLRFASLNAHHDDGIRGINTEIAQRLIDILSPHGQIYITSERELEPQFEPYRIRINPLDMHHVMAFASLYIGDSQTMAAEAGVLGTPFVRFNDFVGRIGYLRELEDVYQLGYGIHATPLSED
jgi:predicted glycosyltransferase